MQTDNTSSSGGADDLDLLADTDAAQSGKTHEAKSTTTPSKYDGKSVEDLINMHQNAEKLISRQGQEVSTLRRLADEVIGLKKPTTQTTEERKPVTVETLLNDPEKAIRDAVANSDVGTRLANAERRNADLEASITEERFVAKYKDFGSDIEDPNFLAWVNKNPLRQALAARTAQKDFTAATNLWDMYEEYKELSGGKVADDQTANKQQKQKQVPNTVKSAPADNGKGKTIYSRAKVMAFKMAVQRGEPSALAKWADPTFQENLNKAYAEDRVK